MSTQAQELGEDRERRPGLGWALLLGALPLAWLTWRFDLVLDDAYISFRYSKNLADGLGLRFNPGAEPPVEGYSNLLWVLWCTLPELVGIDTTVWARASLFAAALALLAAVLGCARRLGAGPLALAATGLFLGTFPPTATWATGGLETMPFALALFLCYERLLGDPARPRGLQAGLAGLAVALLRPDGAVWAGIVLALGLLAAWRGGGAAVLRATRVAAVVLVVGVALHVGCRYAYYGDYLPNTARAKSSLSALTLERGATYAAAYLAHFPTFAVALLVGLAAIRRRGALVLHALVLVAAAFAYAVLVGGDFLPMGRFVFPAVPFAALLFAGGLAALAGPGERRLRLAAPLLVGLFAVSALPAFGRYALPERARAALHYNWNFPEYVPEHELLDGERRRAELWAHLGRALQQHTNPGESLVQESVGAVGYYCDLFLFDQYGLVNREVALREGSGARVSAGHDRYVRPSFFEKDAPTYMNADLIDVGPDGRELRRRRPGPYAREVIPLREEDGFPPGKGLLLARMRR
ncbi:MAG: hypothetical protein AAF682_14165 [Planctomycetota bacterium]